MRTIGPTLRIAEAVTGPRENDTHIGRIAQRLAEIRHMITLEDCIGMCGLTEEEILAIAEHEHLPEVAATALAQYLLSREHGSEDIRDMIVEDIRQAQWSLSSETECNTPADLIIGTADQDLRECCHAMLFAFVG